VHAAWTSAPPEPKEEETKSSVHMTTSDVENLQRKSAAASGQPG